MSNSSTTTLETSNPQPPAKASLVSGLIEISSDLVVYLWPNTLPLTSSTQLHSLQHFVSEMVRRSLTSFSTFELALLYLARLKRHLPDALLEARYPKQSQFISQKASSSPKLENLSLEPRSPASPLLHHSTDSPTNSPLPIASIPITHPLLCGRRSFLSCLILAWKFLQDKTYTNSAWSRICGLAVSEINENEKCVLAALGWGLDVDANVFSAWSKGLEKLAKIRVERTNQQPSLASAKRNLDEVANLVDSAMHFESQVSQQDRMRQLVVHAGLYGNGILGNQPAQVHWSGLPLGVKVLPAGSPLPATMKPPTRRHTRRNSSALKIIAEMHVQEQAPAAGGPMRRKRSLSVGPASKISTPRPKK